MVLAVEGSLELIDSLNTGQGLREAVESRTVHVDVGGKNNGFARHLVSRRHPCVQQEQVGLGTDFIVSGGLVFQSGQQVLRQHKGGGDIDLESGFAPRRRRGHGKHCRVFACHGIGNAVLICSVPIPDGEAGQCGAAVRYGGDGNPLTFNGGNCPALRSAALAVAFFILGVFPGDRPMTVANQRRRVDLVQFSEPGFEGDYRGGIEVQRLIEVKGLAVAVPTRLPIAALGLRMAGVGGLSAVQHRLVGNAADRRAALVHKLHGMGRVDGGGRSGLLSTCRQGIIGLVPAGKGQIRNGNGLVFASGPVRKRTFSGDAQRVVRHQAVQRDLGEIQFHVRIVLIAVEVPIRRRNAGNGDGSGRDGEVRRGLKDIVPALDAGHGDGGPSRLHVAGGGDGVRAFGNLRVPVLHGDGGDNGRAGVGVAARDADNGIFHGVRLHSEDVESRGRRVGIAAHRRGGDGGLPYTLYGHKAAAVHGGHGAVAGLPGDGSLRTVQSVGKRLAAVGREICVVVLNSLRGGIAIFTNHLCGLLHIACKAEALGREPEGGEGQIARGGECLTGQVLGFIAALPADKFLALRGGEAAVRNGIAASDGNAHARHAAASAVRAKGHGIAGHKGLAIDIIRRGQFAGVLQHEAALEGGIGHACGVQCNGGIAVEEGDADSLSTAISAPDARPISPGRRDVASIDFYIRAGLTAAADTRAVTGTRFCRDPAAVDVHCASAGGAAADTRAGAMAGSFHNAAVNVDLAGVLEIPAPYA